MATIIYATVDEALVEAIPEFSASRAEHLADHGELLAHVLFGDFTRFVAAARARGDEDLVTRCLQFLDRALLDGDEMVQNVVAVSFVENIGPWDPAMADFIATWPDALRSEAWRQRDWKPDGRRTPCFREAAHS